MHPTLRAVSPRLLEAALALFYPNWCQVCADEPASPAEGYVGPRCRSGPAGLRYIAPPICERCGLPFAGAVTTAFACSNCAGLDLEFSQARAAVLATDLVLEVVRRYKYHRALWFEPFLAGLLVDRAGPALRAGAWDALIPVPLYPVREREREFNQSARLARHLSAATGLPLNARLLRRVENTRTQTTLGRADRAGNVRDAFAVEPGAGLRGKRVVVIDDVLTTGATTSACARALRRAGAADVCVWTVARGV
jgi:ComF family protein